MSLKTDYTDSQYTQKKYIASTTARGNYTFEDATEYTVEGDYLGCPDINTTNKEYNSLVNSYANVDSLISTIESYNITVSNNSPAAIKSALSALATSKYNAASSAAENTVRNNPTAYGIYDPKGLFDTEAVYREKIRQARVALQAGSIPTITYTPAEEPTGLTFPLSAQAATMIQLRLIGSIDPAYNCYAPMEDAADTKLNNCISKLA